VSIRQNLFPILANDSAPAVGRSVGETQRQPNSPAARVRRPRRTHAATMSSFASKIHLQPLAPLVGNDGRGWSDEEGDGPWSPSVCLNLGAVDIRPPPVEALVAAKCDVPVHLKHVAAPYHTVLSASNVEQLAEWTAYPVLTASATATTPLESNDDMAGYLLPTADTTEIASVSLLDADWKGMLSHWDRESMSNESATFASAEVIDPATPEHTFIVAIETKNCYYSSTAAMDDTPMTIAHEDSRPSIAEIANTADMAATTESPLRFPNVGTAGGDQGTTSFEAAASAGICLLTPKELEALIKDIHSRLKQVSSTSRPPPQSYFAQRNDVATDVVEVPPPNLPNVVSPTTIKEKVVVDWVINHLLYFIAIGYWVHHGTRPLESVEQQWRDNMRRYLTDIDDWREATGWIKSTMRCSQLRLCRRSSFVDHLRLLCVFLRDNRHQLLTASSITPRGCGRRTCCSCVPTSAATTVRTLRSTTASTEAPEIFSCHRRSNNIAAAQFPF